MMREGFWLTMLFALALAGTAWADRVQVYSVQGEDCGNCEGMVAPHLKKLKGAKQWSFDEKKFEFTVTLADGLKDEAVITAIERSGCLRVV